MKKDQVIDVINDEKVDFCHYCGGVFKLKDLYKQESSRKYCVNCGFRYNLKKAIQTINYLIRQFVVT